MKSSKSIIYINFSPYENAGRILDYVRDQFDTVILFSFGFHAISKKRDSDILTIYSQGKITKTYPLIHAPVLSTMTFFLLPIRSFLIIFQIAYHTFRLQREFGPFDVYFTVNAYTAWIGNLLRNLKLVHKTIFWVWDYYPPNHPNKIVSFMRWLYWQFDKPASRQADRVIFLNKRLETLRRKLGLLPKTARYESVGIGTDPIARIQKKKLYPVSLVFLGVVKKSQGLDLIFDAFQKEKPVHKTILHVLGGGPDEVYFKQRAIHTSLTVYFHGYVANDTEVDKIIRQSHIGIAPYMPDESNVSYYSDPSKIKRYISSGLPVISTDVFDFSRQIHRSHAGIIIPYKSEALILAITDIMRSYATYQKNALTLAKKYSYKKLYRALFA